MSAQSTERNAFLAKLTLPELTLLRPHLALFELRTGDCLHHIGGDVRDVIFPCAGLVILSIPARDGAAAGIVVGRENIVGGYAAAAVAPATSDAVVCIGGQALRASVTAFRYVLEQSVSIRRLAAQFDVIMLARAQQTGLCNAAHPVEERICRLLLEADDSNELDRVPLTQATIARILGVRRTTVTLVAQRLEAAEAINCRRGYVAIVNRDQLERRACECYAHLQRFRETLFAGHKALQTTPPVNAAKSIETGKVV
jgi:CRP-like cAMP-binding protein